MPAIAKTLFHRARGKGVTNGLAMGFLVSSRLRREIREAGNLRIGGLRESLAREGRREHDVPGIGPLEVHQRIVAGLPGEAIYIASAMAFDTFKQGEDFFGITSKTAKRRIGGTLPTDEGERAFRVARAMGAALQCFGSTTQAMDYLRAPNLALGGRAPRDLLQTSEGERIVLNEIQTQAEGGPV